MKEKLYFNCALKDTIQISENLMRSLQKYQKKFLFSPLCFYFKGDLGSGKTLFIQYFLKALSLNCLIKSPTYTLVETYQVLLNGRQCCFHHFDLYRLLDPEELEFIGIRDYLSDHAILLIEWPEKGRGYLPQADMVICMDDQGDNKRQIQLKAETEPGENLIKGLNI